jgi:hypothetical protein
LVQRSTDGISFTDIATTTARPVINEAESYSTVDNVAQVNAEILYYRLITIMKNGKRSNSNIISVRKRKNNEADMQVMPNPVRDQFQIMLTSNISTIADIYLIDGNGKVLQTHKELVQPGSNSFSYDWTKGLASGMYYVRVRIGIELLTKKLYVIK